MDSDSEVTVLFHLALGEGCNTLLLSANSSEACPSCHALVLSL